MKHYRQIIAHDRERGPLPLRATLNAELTDQDEQLAGYRINSSLASRAILPLYLEVLIDDIPGEDIPHMFAKAYDLDTAPLYQTDRGPERHPGSLCWLPTPLKMGIQAVGIRQLPPPDDQFSTVDLEWHLSRLDLLATDPASIAEQLPAQAFSWIAPPSAFLADPIDPNARVHLSGVGELTPVVPLYTPDKRFQTRIEKSVAERLKQAPQSTDEITELVPGIIAIRQQDGVTLRETTDWLIGYDFVSVANHLGVSTGAGKGVFTRLLRHVGNQELERMKKQGMPTKKLAKRTARLHWRIDDISRRTGTDILFDVDGRRYVYQTALERERAREIAIQVISGRLKLPGVGPAGSEILRHVFDVPDL